METKKSSSRGVLSYSILAEFYQIRLRSDCGAVRVCLYSCCSRMGDTFRNIVTFLWRMCGRFPGFTQNHRKVGRRTLVHDLRSSKLPSEEIYMTMHSYVWKM